MWIIASDREGSTLSQTHSSSGMEYNHHLVLKPFGNALWAVHFTNVNHSKRDAFGKLLPEAYDWATWWIDFKTGTSIGGKSAHKFGEASESANEYLAEILRFHNKITPQDIASGCVF